MSGDFFRVLGVRPMLGRAIERWDDQAVCAAPGAVISYGFWQREFGGAADVLARNVALEGRSFSILGVTAPSFFGVEVGNRYDVTIPLCADRLMAVDGKGREASAIEWNSYSASARLRSRAVSSRCCQGCIDFLSLRASLPYPNPFVARGVATPPLM